MQSQRILPFLSLLAVLPLGAQQLDSATLAGMRWRNIGPANHQGRTTDVQGIPWPSRTFYVATAGGGVWKTTHAGTSFHAVFENEHVAETALMSVSCVAPAALTMLRKLVLRDRKSVV